MRTYSPRASELTHTWHVVDADGLVLGRMASEIARVLEGKHRPGYAPHADSGDFVVVVNAAKVVLGAKKADATFAYRHSGYPGGLKRRSYAEILASAPEHLVERVVRGMLPKTRLGHRMLGRLKVYAGPAHPHGAQSPVPLDIPAARRVLAGA